MSKTTWSGWKRIFDSGRGGAKRIRKLAHHQNRTLWRSRLSRLDYDEQIDIPKPKSAYMLG